MQGNYLEQALGMIHSRRLAAEQQNRERIMEIAESPLKGRLLHSGSLFHFRLPFRGAVTAGD